MTIDGFCVYCGPVEVTLCLFSDMVPGAVHCECSCGHSGYVVLSPRHERQLLDAGVKTLSEEAAEFLSGSSV